MSITLGSNILSQRAQRQLEKTDQSLSSVFERLSSGQRINRASDDAAGLAIAESLQVAGRVYTQGIRNLNDGISALQIVDQTLAELSLIVERQLELAEQSANGIYTTEQRSALDSEAQALNEEFDRIVASTEFNDLKLLDGSTPDIALQTGFGSDAVLSATILEAGTTTTYQGLGTYSSSLVDTVTGLSRTVLFGSSQILVGDFNDDGIDDIATVAIYEYGGVDARLGVDIIDGEGSGAGFTLTIGDTGFMSSYAYADFAFVNGRVADIDGDGNLDVQAYGYQYANFLIHSYDFTFYGDGTGNLSASPGGFIPGSEANSMVTGDFNGDGVTDRATDDGNGTITIEIQDTVAIESVASVPQALSLENFSLATESGALDALTSLRESLNSIQDTRSNIGAALSRVEVSANILSALVTNYAAAEGRIRDADIAEESAQLVSNRIQQDVIASILAQANQQPSIALSLLSTGPP